MNQHIFNNNLPTFKPKLKKNANLSGKFAADPVFGVRVSIGDCLLIWMSYGLRISPGAAIPSSSSIYRKQENIQWHKKQFYLP